jgi:NADH:ubiquinone oxidoreductase subunit C
MTNEEIKEQLEATFGDAITHAEVSPHGECVIRVAVEQLLAVMEDLKQNKDFDYLSQITGVDYLEQDREPRFDVVYELFSLTKERRIVISVCMWVYRRTNRPFLRSIICGGGPIFPNASCSTCSGSTLRAIPT